MSLFSRAFSACKNDTEIAIWESTRFWHLSHCEVATALASLHICADSFVWAFATVLKCRVFYQMVIGLPPIRAANAWRVCTFAWDTQQCDCEGESAHVCAESPESSSLDNALRTKRSCFTQMVIWFTFMLETKAPRSLHIVQSTGLDFGYLLAFAFSRVHWMGKCIKL